MTNPGLLELPAVRTPPIAELADQARECRRLRLVRRLAQWTGDRRITKSGQLTLADARLAVQELGLPGDQGPGVAKARSAADFTELDELWRSAVELELLSTHLGRATPGPGLAELARDDDNRSVLDIWAELFDHEVDEVFWSDELARATVPLLVKIYVEPVLPIGELVAGAAASGAGAGRLEVPVRRLLGRLNELGATTSDGDSVRVTGLGQFGLSGWFETIGVGAPTITDLGDADPIDIMDLAMTEDGAGRESLISEWIKAKGPERAADELVELASVGSSADRNAAFGLLERIGDSAQDAVRDGLDHPAVHAYATSWLRSRGLAGPDPTPADSHWLFIDLMNAHLGDDEEAQRIAVTDMARGADSGSAAVMAGLSDCTHPQTVDVLEAMARYHPDPAAAKAARKAAMQARSRVLVERQATESAVAPRGEVYQLKITLEDVEPPVWRRIQVPSLIDLAELHAVIQTAMGWTNSHLHMFEIDDERYADPDWVDGAVSPDRSTLAEVAGEGEQFEYVYDFGDHWRHGVLVEKALPATSEKLPVCLAGRRACPPEDVGGPWRYAEFLEAYDDPAHEEHQQFREWAGDGFDATSFDAKKVTRKLRGLRLR
jgi:hypothetical protein